MGKGLLSDLIVGLDFLKQFKAITIEYPGKERPITISRRDRSGRSPPTASVGVERMRVNATSKTPPRVMKFPADRLLAGPNMLFQGLDRTVKSIKDGSRRYSVEDRDFMSEEVK